MSFSAIATLQKGTMSLDCSTFDWNTLDPGQLWLVSDPRLFRYHWIKIRLDKPVILSLSLWLCSQSIFHHSISSKWYSDSPVKSKSIECNLIDWMSRANVGNIKIDRKSEKRTGFNRTLNNPATQYLHKILHLTADNYPSPPVLSS